MKSSPKKVALVNPPNDHMLPTNVPSFLLDKGKGYLPPLGLMYLASYLTHSSDHDLLFIDGLVDELSHDEIAKKIVDFGAEIVGIGTITFYLYDCIKVAESIRRISPNIKIVMGGPHVAIFPEETAQLSCCDYALKGECEKTFLQLINALPDEDAIKKVPGIYFYDKASSLFANPNVTLIDDIDTLPPPDRSIIPYQKYDSILSRDKYNRGYVTTMFSSRGCPYKCIFCDRPNLGKSFRYNSPEYVVNEIEEACKLDITEFFFYDDTFSVNKKRVFEICDLIVERKLNITWDIRTRVNDVSFELLEAMKEAGLVRVHFGVEAGNEDILRILKKGITKEATRTAFTASQELGIERLAYFMFGTPGETKEQMQETMDFAKELDPEFCHYAILTPFPGTPIYLDMLKNNICDDYWKEYALNPHPDFRPPFYPGDHSREELINIMDQAYKAFYLNTRYIFQSLKKVRTIGKLAQYTKIGMKMMRAKNTHLTTQQKTASAQTP